MPDLYPRAEQQAQEQAPTAFQHILDRVKPAREQIRDPGSRKRWWRFGRDKPDLRRALTGLRRYVVVPEVSKHRLFTFVVASVRPDHTLVVFALDDSMFLGILSSRVHVAWSLAAGSRLGVGNDPRYNRSVCFDPFPFPAATDEQKARIREIGEGLDAHRKRQQAAHPDLTLMNMYNVLTKLRAGTPLTKKDKLTHERGLCSVLLKIHDDLDAGVFDAYGWPVTLTDEEILERLVALNAERAEEERRGLVRWLRPEFQCPEAAAAGSQAELEGISTAAKAAAKVPATKRGGLPWPKGLVERIQAVRATPEAAPAPLPAEAVARSFKRARTDAVTEILETLVTVGQARRLDDGRFAV